MSGPTFINFLQLIERDVEVLELWAFESCKISELVVAEVEIFKVHKAVFICKNTDVLDFILAQVEMNQIKQLL